jgi:GNAT superfamily N-acetyltransferase
MIDFRKIKSSVDPLFGKMYELCQSAFPAVERRTLDSLESILNHDTRFVMTGLLKDGEFVGFINHWQFERFVYAEHFAVNPKLRGQNIGSEVMKTFLSNINLPVVFEVEMPENEMAIRRIVFYERLGCKLLLQKYAQPCQNRYQTDLLHLTKPISLCYHYQGGICYLSTKISIL